VYTRTYCEQEYTTYDNEGNPITTSTQSRTETITEYRHWYVNAEWFDNLDYSRSSIVFFMGMDLVMNQDTNPCPFDTVIAVIIIIFLTYISFGASQKLGVNYWILAAIIASGVISVGLTLGVWKGKDARNMAIVAAILALAGGYGNLAATSAKQGMTTTIAIQMATLVAGTGLTVMSTVEAYEQQKYLEDGVETLESLEKEEKLYESNLRLSLSGYDRLAENYIRTDPYNSIRKSYQPYLTYKNDGFKNG
jgi:small-conductance mechanosensitive channel